MDNKITTIKERILYLADLKEYAKEDFFRKLGVSYGNFKGKNKKRPLNSKTLADILTMIPDANAEWLLTGKGEILKSHDTNIELDSDRPNNPQTSRETRLIKATKEATQSQQVINQQIIARIEKLEEEIKKHLKLNSPAIKVKKPRLNQ